MRLLLVLLISLAPTLVRAQEAEYRRLTDSAVQEHDLGHYEEARALFAKAHEINPNARTWWGMGAAAFEARQYTDAIRLLSQALEDQRKPLTEEQRKSATSLIARSREFLVRLRIDVTPKDATVSVDGIEVKTDASGVALLDLGLHEVLVSAPGYQSSARSVRWPAGEVTLRAQLIPTDGVRAVDAPPPPTVVAPPAQHPTSRALAAVKWISLGAALASFGVAGAGLGLRNEAADDLNDPDKCPAPRKTSCAREAQTVRQGEIMGIVGISAAGLFSALTIVSFILDRPKKPPVAGAWRCDPQGVAALSCRTSF